MELSSGADIKKLSEAILLKIALEGVDYQTARREVMEHQAVATRAESPGTVGEATAGVEIHLDAAEISATRVTLDLTTPDGTLHAEVTQVSARVLHVDASAQVATKKKDPLVLDLDGSGPATSGAAGARAFDLAGDGDARPTSNVVGGTAFLALDRNDNGRIDDGRELFGDQHGAEDGYEELAKFDDNRDGRIDRQDKVFDLLRLLYGDGHTGSLGSQGIASIALGAVAAPARTSGGDDVFRRATATTEDGRVLNTYALGLQRFDQVI